MTAHRLLHLSDLHFGAVDERAVRPLLDAVHALEPTLIAVTGDLTQRARSQQFRDAAAFLDELPAVPRLVVPGNHDLPLYDLPRRLLRPFGRFKRWIQRDLEPTFVDDRVAVVGLCTPRRSVPVEGRVNRRQLRRVRHHVDRAPIGTARIVLAHHPFVSPEEASVAERTPSRAVAGLLASGVDLVLTGHGHRRWIGRLGGNVSAGAAALTVHAGTALSHRRRGEANSFTSIEVEAERFVITMHVFDPDARSFGVRERREVLRRLSDGRALVAH